MWQSADLGRILTRDALPDSLVDVRRARTLAAIGPNQGMAAPLSTFSRRQGFRTTRLATFCEYLARSITWRWRPWYLNAHRMASSLRTKWADDQRERLIGRMQRGLNTNLQVVTDAMGPRWRSSRQQGGPAPPLACHRIAALQPWLPCRLVPGGSERQKNFSA